MIGVRAGDSRRATDELLASLRADRGAAGWARFLARSAARSVEQGAQHPRALAEVAALHSALAVLARKGGSARLPLSLALCVTHLGLLEGERSLGAANALSLVRAHLPLIAPEVDRRLLALAATATDVMDGVVARRYATSPFGQYADSFADAAFWPWFAARHESCPEIRALALAAWIGPITLGLVASLARGKTFEVPRHRWLRPAVAMQALLIVRALVRKTG